MRASLLDKALLVLALGIDRGLGLVGLVAAGQEERSGGEGGCEGSDRELVGCQHGSWRKHAARGSSRIRMRLRPIASPF